MWEIEREKAARFMTVRCISSATHWLGLAALLLVSGGCHTMLTPSQPLPVTVPEPTAQSDVPRELAKVSLPPYTIEPPDILLIDAVKIVPKPPHYIEPFDALGIRVDNALLESPIAGVYVVDPQGRVDLGPAYGKVNIKGMTIDEARTAINDHLAETLQEPVTSATLASSSGAQPLSGEHLVGQDGTVNLGTYGNVYLAGMTIPEARLAIEKQLSETLESPEVFLDVLAFNSKAYYIITEGAGFGDNVVKIPITGNETVLDAVASLGGLSQLSSKRIWISRPAPNGVGCEQILPVDWDAMTRGASTATNYQLLPGDRLFIAQDNIVALDNLIGKITRPVERLFGFNILGVQMVNRYKTMGTNRRIGTF
jgi:polysaccharide export outer membrane protein